MKDVRSTVMQLSGRWGNTCYNMLCLAVEAARGLPREEFQTFLFACAMIYMEMSSTSFRPKND